MEGSPSKDAIVVCAIKSGIGIIWFCNRMYRSASCARVEISLRRFKSVDPCWMSAWQMSGIVGENNGGLGSFMLIGWVFKTP